MERDILHCDMNNFFASVECRLNPELKKYPVAVCGSVEERHGIVLAKNELAKAQGVGLAAPQVGFLKRIFIMDIGEGPIECVNPVILKENGKQRVVEGCLSCPDEWGYVTRPNKVKLRAQNRKGEFFEISLVGLGAQCASHENDHLDGRLFIDKVEEFINPEEE